MDISGRLAISYYKTIATLNKEHNIFLVQHRDTNKIYVKKILDIYNIDIYHNLMSTSIPGIPQIVEIYEEEGQLTIIENYISGTTLAQKMEEASLSPHDLWHYTLELCQILEKLHTFTPPMVHRDIKPSNIIITEYNHVVLLDFNAAKYYTPSAERDTILLGTPGYAAPEQYGFGSSSPQTDIYSLGILLNEMAASINFTSEELLEITNRCVQLNPGNRLSCISELRTAVEDILCSRPEKKQKSFSVKPYLLPGFRGLTPWKMLIAVPGYFLLFDVCLNVELENRTGIVLWGNRIFFLIMLLSIIFICFNYLDVRRYFPMCKHPNKYIRYPAIFLFNFLWILSLFIFLAIFESILLT